MKKTEILINTTNGVETYEKITQKYFRYFILHDWQCFLLTNLYPATFFFKVGLFLSILWTVLIGGVFLFFKRKNKNGTSLQKATDEKLQRLTSEKEDFYLQQGLSKEEMIFFRETMNTAKKSNRSIGKKFHSSF